MQTCLLPAAEPLPEPPFVYTARTQMYAHVKDPVSTCRTRVGLTAGGMKTRKHCTQERGKGEIQKHENTAHRRAGGGVGGGGGGGGRDSEIERDTHTVRKRQADTKRQRIHRLKYITNYGG